MNNHPLARSLRYLLPLAAVGLLAAWSGARAGHETTYKVDPLSSIAWWQVVPHLNRLWSTTCPEERSWLPPAGHDAGGEDASEIGKPTWKSTDTTQVPIPLLPRYRVRAVCNRKAVHGELVAPDTATWKGAHGDVSVDETAFTQGETWDDDYRNTAIMNAQKFPEISYKIDSIVDVTTSGDTLRALTVGTFTMHGVSQPLSVHVYATHEAGGLRVRGRWFIPSTDLVDVYHMSSMALGFGVGNRIWKLFSMGIDVVMRPEGVTS